jgi:hypothetical protein
VSHPQTDDEVRAALGAAEQPMPTRAALRLLGFPLENGSHPPEAYTRLNQLVARGVLRKPARGQVEVADDGGLGQYDGPQNYRCDLHLRLRCERVDSAEFDRRVTALLENLAHGAMDLAPPMDAQAGRCGLQLTEIGRGATWQTRV